MHVIFLSAITVAASLLFKGAHIRRPKDMSLPAPAVDVSRLFEGANSQQNGALQTGSPARDWFDLGFQSDGAKLTLGQERSSEIGKLRSKVVLLDADPTSLLPVRKPGWQSENSLRTPVLGPIFLVGQVGANSDSLEWQRYKLVGRTGVGWRLPPWLGGEVQVRGGKALTNFDVEREMAIPDQSKSFIELGAKWALPGSLQLEFLGEAVANPATGNHDFFKRDVRLALPLAHDGQVHIGAKYWWTESAAPASWRDHLRLYLSVEFRR